MHRPSDARAADPLLKNPNNSISGHDDDDDNNDKDAFTDRGRPSYRTPSHRANPLQPTTPSQSEHSSHTNNHHHTPLPRSNSKSSMTTETRTRTRSTMRSLSPPHITLSSARSEARKRYTYAAFFLLTSLISFTVQTLLASHIQHDLGWDKAYCMLYLTHGSWVFLWPLQLGVLYWGEQRKRGGGGGVVWRRFWEGHVRSLRGIALAVETRDVRAAVAATGSGRGGAGLGGGLLEYGHSPWPYLGKVTAMVTTALTVAGLSWYLAVSMTTPSDLTAIYNCSAFFAYAFSVPLLKEKLRAGKMLAVAVAIVGVLVVAYGDGGDESSSATGDGALDPGTRFAGNLIIGAGSVLYGLYEVLYKRYACPPDGLDATQGVIFANTFGTLIGLFTVFVLWIPLPILHVLGWETFEIPTGQTAWLLFISVVMNMVFSGSFLVLISLTSPVLSSVAALLTIFMVAIVDWFVTGTPLSGAAVLGGLLIIAAFGMLSWSTWREMNEEERRKQVDFSGDEDD